jgi:hypothetical protein
VGSRWRQPAANGSGELGGAVGTRKQLGTGRCRSSRHAMGPEWRGWRGPSGRTSGRVDEWTSGRVDEWVPSAEMQRVQAACCEGQEAAAAPASLAREALHWGCMGRASRTWTWTDRRAWLANDSRWDSRHTQAAMQSLLLPTYSGGARAGNRQRQRPRNRERERGCGWSAAGSLNRGLCARLQVHTGLHSRAEAGQRQAPP